MENEKLVERDPDDHSREYIPLPGGWEAQTKGAGSSYRLLDTKTGERHLILSGRDWKPMQEFFTRFAHEVFAASRDERKQAAAALTAAEARIKMLTNDVGILLANIRQTEEATGEGPEGEDAQIVDQIERDHEVRQALTGASDAG